MSVFGPATLAEFRTYHHAASVHTVFEEFPFEDWLIANLESFVDLYPGIPVTAGVFRVWMRHRYGTPPCKMTVLPYTSVHAEV